MKAIRESTAEFADRTREITDAERRRMNIEEEARRLSNAVWEAYKAGTQSARELAEANRALREIETARHRNLQRLEEATRIANERLREDLEVRRLVAQGATVEAEAMRQMLEQRREMEDLVRQGADAATIAMLDLVHALERAAAAERQAREFAESLGQSKKDAAEQKKLNAATRRDFEADLEARQRALAGDDAGAMAIRMEIQANQELDAARKLFEAGVITEEMFRTLADVLRGEVTAAVDALTKAHLDAKRAMEEDLRVRELVATGRQDEADALRLQLKQAEELQKAIEAGMDQAFIDKLKQVQALERNPAAPTVADAVAGASEVERSVRAISQTQATTNADLQRTANIHLSEIAFNTRYLKGDGPAIFSSNTSAFGRQWPGVTINLDLTIQGDVIGGSFADGYRFGQGATQAIGQQLDEYLGSAVAAISRTSGIPTVP
jgi:hypothetical protein